jgi:hypothetical protein
MPSSCTPVGEGSRQSKEESETRDRPIQGPGARLVLLGEAHSHWGPRGLLPGTPCLSGTQFASSGLMPAATMCVQLEEMTLFLMPSHLIIHAPSTCSTSSSPSAGT